MDSFPLRRRVSAITVKVAWMGEIGDWFDFSDQKANDSIAVVYIGCRGETNRNNGLCVNAR
jgi:hypothetical protein